MAMKSESILIPENHTATEFLRGQASKIFEDVAKKDNVVIVNKNSRPKNVIISYDRYRRLKENGADI
jgi:prevent-host-death family protein